MGDYKIIAEAQGINKIRLDASGAANDYAELLLSDAAAGEYSRRRMAEVIAALKAEMELTLIAYGIGAREISSREHIKVKRMLKAAKKEARK